MRFAFAAAAAATATLAMLASDDAHACGGTFLKISEDVSVTDHRFVFKLGTNETILWDQIRYTGTPSEFAWVLPVHAGAVLQLSHDEFMATLDKATKPTTTISSPECDDTSGCSACQADDIESANGTGGSGGVTIVSEQTIGPYDVLTLHANGAQTIGDFLTQNGFAIPDASKAIIDAYTKEGFDFIAMRLRPGQGVQAMQPVRVVTQGADPTLPLRMIGAGAGANVGITMWVIAEGRYQAANFPNALFDDKRLTRYGDGGTSFGDVENAIMAQDGGRTWITEYAGQNFSSVGLGTLRTAYQASCQGKLVQIACEADAGDEAGTGDAGSDARDLDASEDAGDSDAGDAGDAGDADAGDAGDGADASSDTGAPGADDGTDAAACTQTVDACSQFDDFDVALRGLNADGTWLTRLRANLPTGALTVDLQLGAAAQENVLPDHVIPSGATCDDDSGCESAPLSRGAMGSFALAGLTAVILGSLVRRRRR